MGMATCRRHLPTCMTSGMLVPDGTPVRWNAPVASVSAGGDGMTRDLRAALVAGDALGNGVERRVRNVDGDVVERDLAGRVVHLPESDVVAVPVQVATWHWSPVHAAGPVEPGQTLAVPPAPQVMPLLQLPQSSMPPQPLPIVPQYWPPVGRAGDGRAVRIDAEVGDAARTAGHAAGAAAAIECAAAAVADLSAVQRARGRVAGERNAARRGADPRVALVGSTSSCRRSACARSRRRCCRSSCRRRWPGSWRRRCRSRWCRCSRSGKRRSRRSRPDSRCRSFRSRCRPAACRW